MYCSNCGAETNDDAQFCSKCGIALNIMTIKNLERKRHGFTTFWLIFSIVLNILLFPSFYSDSLFIDYTEGAILLLDVTCAIDIVSCILLLCWKKIGFAISIITTSLVAISDIISGHGIGYILLNASMLVILYGILQIRKNGKSTWEQLG
jgi:predicted nucleic acid-binding Zn ribbon protein